MARTGTTHSRFHHLLLALSSLLLCLLLLPARLVVVGQCPDVPPMTAEGACGAVCGTPHMRDLCLGTLLAPAAAAGAAAALPATGLAAAAVRSALDSYAATTAAATSLMDSGAVQDSEKAAYGSCMVGYGRARISMSRVADDLAAGCDGVAGLKRDYTAALRGMDMCGTSLLDHPATPLYSMNLADRNKTLLATLLCSLVAQPLRP